MKSLFSLLLWPTLRYTIFKPLFQREVPCAMWTQLLNDLLGFLAALCEVEARMVRQLVTFCHILSHLLLPPFPFSATPNTLHLHLPIKLLAS